MLEKTRFACLKLNSNRFLKLQNDRSLFETGNSVKPDRITYPSRVFAYYCQLQVTFQEACSVTNVRITVFIISITTLLDAHWLREYNYFINRTAVQLMILPQQTKWRKAQRKLLMRNLKEKH